MVRTKLIAVAMRSNSSEQPRQPQKQNIQTPSPKKRPAMDISRLSSTPEKKVSIPTQSAPPFSAGVSTTKPKVKVAQKHPPKNPSTPLQPSKSVAAGVSKSPAKMERTPSVNNGASTRVVEPPQKRRRVGPSIDGLATKVAEFDAKKEIWDFLYSSEFPLAFLVAARVDATEPKRQRILRCNVSSNKLPNIKIWFRGEMYNKEYTEHVALWTLEQMRAFVQAFDAFPTSSGRRGKPALTSSSIAARCPSLWWSLLVWSLGCRIGVQGRTEDRWRISTPVAAPVPMENLVEALLSCSSVEVSPTIALRMMTGACA